MGTNFNPAGLKSFAQMGFPSTYNTLPQTPQMQTPQMQVPQIQMPQAPQALPIQNPAIQSMQPLQNNQNINLEKTPKQDIVTIAGKEFKKKNVIIAGIGIAAAAAAAAALCFTGKAMPAEAKAASINAQEIIDNAKAMLARAKIFIAKEKSYTDEVNSISKNAGEIAAKVRDVVEETMAAFQKGEGADPGSSITRVITRGDGIDTMEEFIETGGNRVLFRTSKYNKCGFLQGIEVRTAEDKKDVYTFVGEGKIKTFKSGVVNLPNNGGSTTECTLDFDNGKIIKYVQGLYENSDCSGFNKLLEIVNDVPKLFKSGHKKATGGITTTDVIIDFKNGNPYKVKEEVELRGSTYSVKRKFNTEKRKYQEGYVSNYADRTETRDRIIFLDRETGYPLRYEEGVICKDDRTTDIWHSVIFQNNKLVKYIKGTKLLDNRMSTSELSIDYRDSEPVRYMKDIEKTQGRKLTAKKEYALKRGGWTEVSSSNRKAA